MADQLFTQLIALMLLAPIALASPIAVYWAFNQDNRRARPLVYLAVTGLGISAAVATYIAITYPLRTFTYTYPWITLPGFTINISFILDFLSRYMGLLTAWLAFIIGIYSIEYLANDYRLGWYWFFYNTFAASMLLTVYANNLILMFIGWEGLGISSWALIGHWYKDDDELTFVGRVNDFTVLNKPAWTTPSYAAYRAILTVRVGDMFMLGSIAAIILLTGASNFTTIPWLSMLSRVGVAGTALILLAFLMGPFTKSAQFPFNDWLLTAMTGPTSVSALLHSATMVAAGAYIFMRLTASIYGSGAISLPGVQVVYVVVLYMGLLTAVLGSIMALGVDERKVILAASTMASLGLMMAITAVTPFSTQAVTIGGYTLPLAVLVAFIYLIVHALSKATLFLVSGHLIHETGTRFNMGDWDLARRLKVAFYATLAAALTLGGLPPLAGYWVHAAMDEVTAAVGQYVGWGAYALLIIASVAYAAFLARFISLNFIKGGKSPTAHEHGGRIMAFAYGLTGTAALATLAVIPAIAPVFIYPGLDPVVVAVGVILWLVFIVALIKPRAQSLGQLGIFLQRRFYLQVFMDVIIAEFGRLLITFAYLFSSGIGALFNELTPRVFLGFSRVIRRLQSGAVIDYAKYLYASIVVILIIVLILVIAYG